MKYELFTQSIMHQLGIGKNYKGCDYIIYGISLISQDEDYLCCVTKFLYIDIAKKYSTSSKCVEKNIRKVIHIIWEDIEINKEIIRKIFGNRYLLEKPSNKVFFDLLYKYVKFHNLFESLLDDKEMICPISNNVCIACPKIIAKLRDWA